MFCHQLPDGATTNEPSHRPSNYQVQERKRERKGKGVNASLWTGSAAMQAAQSAFYFRITEEGKSHTKLVLSLVLWLVLSRELRHCVQWETDVAWTVTFLEGLRIPISSQVSMEFTGAGWTQDALLEGQCGLSCPCPPFPHLLWPCT